MNASTRARSNDMLGLGTLAVLGLLGLLFRSSPISFLAPGFPLLRPADWPPEASVTNHVWEPIRRSNIYDSSRVAYYVDYRLSVEAPRPADSIPASELRPSYYLFKQWVTWYADPANAVAELQRTHTEYVASLDPIILRITDIPDLNFASRADQHYLECKQANRFGTAFAPQHTIGCVYWAVYDHYYTQVKLSGYEEMTMSTALLSKLVNRADLKLWEASH